MHPHLCPLHLQGLLLEKDIDTALGRQLTARFKLGVFDPPGVCVCVCVPVLGRDWRGSPHLC